MSRRVGLFLVAVAAAGLTPLAAAEDITSHLGNAGPPLEAGLTPSALGWGADDQAYPDRFVVNPTDGAEMVWVPAGTLWMGSTQAQIDQQWTDNGWDPALKRAFTKGEQPAHEVTITRGFWLSKHEVTTAQYARFLHATGRAAPSCWREFRAAERNAVSMVNWADCAAYAAWAGGSLPTEAQWEWSARGPEGRIFPWGDAWDRTRCVSAEYWAQRALPNEAAWMAWFRGVGNDARYRRESYLSTTQAMRLMRAVGSLPTGASWCGALDLAGSVSEWCSDWYAEGYYTESPPTDPTGPASGACRVLRGGGWADSADLCRSVRRNRYVPGDRSGDFGFRFARAAAP
jgi:formylglycine-generating enzyme required for sulfatase activity